MKWFSERKGLKKVRTEIQIESMDDALKNRLWNVFFPFFLYQLSLYDEKYRGMRTFVHRFWDEYLKLPTTSAPDGSKEISTVLADYFSKCTWSEVYDFLECVVAYFPNEEYTEGFMKACNAVLESELSAYRFVGRQVTQITSEIEIAEIEEALESPLKTVKTHLENALNLFSDRQSPDYRNSIKESISAVEAICKVITKNENATLGDALNIIEREGKINLHGALKKAFSSLYGYTSNADGIRHGFSEETINANFEEAKFMLVACSAFVNYLVIKSTKMGIKLG